jgi:hypothetical protein
VLGTGAFRARGARGEHGVDYVGDRGQLIIIRISDQKLREFHAVAETVG